MRLKNGPFTDNLNPGKSAELNIEQILRETSLSIVIPARNEQGTIEALLDRLASEIPQYLNAEIIIANNSDPGDQTEAVVELYKQIYPQMSIRLINTRRGVSNARNGGAAAAKNEYIFFLDADARFRPGFIKRALANMKESGLDLGSFDLEPNTDNRVDRVIAEVN